MNAQLEPHTQNGKKIEKRNTVLPVFLVLQFAIAHCYSLPNINGILYILPLVLSLDVIKNMIW